ncbi:FAD:protein FMN transferase [Roseibium sp.]|uniref:FAD:protein FMN transferase n=1 Tax=Roseibium sp. TaxID=1936156 RepID=UPI003B522EE9
MTGIEMPESKLSRRRFLKISAASASAVALFPGAAAAAPTIHRWTGIALGAGAEINLVHNDAHEAKSLFGEIELEIARLENIFSLYKSESELSRLNRQGLLEGPSLDLLKLLSLAKQLHQATGGAFDPTIQPLWAYYAAGDYDSRLHKQALSRTGFSKVQIESGKVGFRSPDMALTLNGIAQGFITDRVSELLKSKGFDNVAVDLGELRLNGGAPVTGESEKGWPVTLRPDPKREELSERTALSNMAVASSAQTGTTFDEAGKNSHILDPRTGAPVRTDLSAISVLSRSAAVADGLSTAALVLGEKGLKEVLALYADTTAFAVRQNGETAWLNG